MVEVIHPATRQVCVKDELASGLLIALAFLYLDYLARIFRMQVAGALLPCSDRLTGKLQYLLFHRGEKDSTNWRRWLYPFRAL
jgi:hypothetical protein